jgi:hypothetical protein
MTHDLRATPELLTQSATLLVAASRIVTRSRSGIAGLKQDLCSARECLDSSRLAIRRAGGAGGLDTDFPAEVPPLIVLL